MENRLYTPPLPHPHPTHTPLIRKKYEQNVLILTSEKWKMEYYTDEAENPQRQAFSAITRKCE
jgi:hypothetical protein